ncbi:MAG: hypothetical protein KC479_02575 [Dehalococcoidia bacterium]|nr:hypothetical protein [Dehalococcoidia bacterium]
MFRKTLIAILAALVVSVGYAGSGTGEARTVRSTTVNLELVKAFDPAKSEFPKGIAFDSEGTLYYGMQFLGEVRKISTDGTEATIATVPYSGPIGSGLLGAVAVVEGESGSDVTIYTVFVDGDSGQSTGVYRIDDGSLSRVPGTEAIQGNGMTADGDGNIFVAESFTGSIWRIGHDSGVVELWLQHELLEGDGSLGFGVSLGVGDMVVDSQSLLVTVEEGSRMVRIPINADGSAGDASVVVEDSRLYMTEGIAVADDGSTYVSSWFNSTLYALGNDGTLSIVAGAEDGLLGPVTLAFGQGPLARYLYVVNQSGFIFDNPQPALYRLVPPSGLPPVASPTSEVVPAASPTAGAPLPPNTGSGSSANSNGGLPVSGLLVGLMVVAGAVIGAAMVRSR